MALFKQFLVSTAIFLLCLHPSVQARTTDCAHWLRLAEELSSQDKGRRYEFASVPSVAVTSEFKGRHGGTRYLLENREGIPWMSTARDTTRAPQGDPRWMIFLLGKRAAPFLGFELLDNRLMTAPDALLSEFLSTRRWHVDGVRRQQMVDEIQGWIDEFKQAQANDPRFNQPFHILPDLPRDNWWQRQQARYKEIDFAIGLFHRRRVEMIRAVEKIQAAAN